MTRPMALLTLTLLLLILTTVVGVTAHQADGHKPAKLGGRTIFEWRRSANIHADWVRKLRGANRARVSMVGPWGVVRGFHCIHRFEGSWTDPDDPHHGGLQMDRDFQRSYGLEFYRALGTADRWPPFVQLAVAMRAYYGGRGYSPWPNTARRCGLI